MGIKIEKRDFMNKCNKLPNVEGFGILLRLINLETYQMSDYFHFEIIKHNRQLREGFYKV